MKEYSHWPLVVALREDFLDLEHGIGIRSGTVLGLRADGMYSANDEIHPDVLSIDQLKLVSVEVLVWGRRCRGCGKRASAPESS